MRAINWSDNRRKTGFVPVSKDNLYKSKISCPCFAKEETSAKRNCLIKSRKLLSLVSDRLMDHGYN